LNGLLSAERVTADLDNYRKLTREHAEIAPVVALYNAYLVAEHDVQSAQSMMSDPEMKELAEAEIRDGKQKLVGIESELQRRLLPSDPNDDRNIFLEIRAGDRRATSRHCSQATWYACTHVTPSGKAGAWKSCRRVRATWAVTRRSSSSSSARGRTHV
jgi:hypothetical protein